MQKSLIRKGLVLGIILLFVGASVTPTMGGFLVKQRCSINDENNIRDVAKTPGNDIIGESYISGNYWSSYTNKDAECNGVEINSNSLSLPNIGDVMESMVVYVDAGRDIITYTGQPTLFRWSAVSPAYDEVMYIWDFNGDDLEDYTERAFFGQTLEKSYTYNISGTYNATLKVMYLWDSTSASYDHVKVVVKTGSGNQTYVEESEYIKNDISPLAADGVTDKYAVMINGGSESRFWIDVNFTYHMLLEDYNYPADHVYLFNWNGSNPDGENPNGMIDYPADQLYIEQVFANLSGIIDSDDLLYVWVTDHGCGYFGPGSRYYGVLYGYDAPFYDPGDEQDYLESDFKLRSFCVYGDYYSDMGMGVWKVQKVWHDWLNCYQFFRLKCVSSFSDVYFEEINATVGDSDVYIEYFFDYLEGDYDQDGFLDEDNGEVYDYDGDGIPPYDHENGTFDEDDWGAIHHYRDNVTSINTGVPMENLSGPASYMIFDYGLDNHVDIDLYYLGGVLEVDGTDLDNEGLFDGMDINEDGDMNDWVSIDEQICLYWYPNIRDDVLAMYLNNINAEVISIFMEPCFSGGFIWDLSASNRVICTATVEEDSSWGNTFVRAFTSAFHGADIYGNPVNADYSGDGNISMSEAFNYATENDPWYPDLEIPQYDDNGDGISHAYPIPNGSDGVLGSLTFLWGRYYDNVEPEITNVQADPSILVTGGYINISAMVTDNIMVDEIYLKIIYPDYSIKNFSIRQNRTINTYYCNTTYSMIGSYLFSIWANDTSGNANNTSGYTFEIIENSVPYQPHDPVPSDGDIDVDIYADLFWSGGDQDPGDTVTYDVYFGTSSSPPKVVSNQTGTIYDPGTMSFNTQYFWKIVAWDNHGASNTSDEWEFATRESIPDLDCSGTLSWTDVPPGDIVTDTFTIENDGEPLSLLDWQIDSYPEWGTWSFNPESGTGLEEGDTVIIDVEVIAPDEPETEFTGEVKIVNSEDPSDYCIIAVSLVTPVNQFQSNQQIPRFMQIIIEHYPVMRQVLGL